MLVKLFADRQLVVDDERDRLPALTDGAVARAPARMVDALDREALAARTARITRALAAEIMAERGLNAAEEFDAIGQYDLSVILP